MVAGGVLVEEDGAGQRVVRWERPGERNVDKAERGHLNQVEEMHRP